MTEPNAQTAHQSARTANQIAIEVLDGAGRAVSVEFSIRRDSVEAWTAGRCSAVFDRWLLRAWLSAPAGLYGFDGVQRVLKVSCADDDSVEVFDLIELVVVDACLDVVAELFFQEGLTFFATFLPQIRNRHDVEVQLLVVVLKSREQRLPKAVGEAYDANAHTIVGTDDVCITFSTKGRRAQGNDRCFLNKISSRVTHRIQGLLVILRF